MNNKRVFSTIISTFGIFIALAIALLSAATVPTVQAQDEPTDPHQPTIQALINQRFTQTAHPQTPNGKTQTAQARTNKASTAAAVLNATLTATAAFINTVDAQFNLLVQGTAQAGLAQLHISPSGLSVNYPKGWLAQDGHQSKQEVVEIGNNKTAIAAIFGTNGLNPSGNFRHGQLAAAILNFTGAFKGATGNSGVSASLILKAITNKLGGSLRTGDVKPIVLGDADAAAVDGASDFPSFQAMLIFFVKDDNAVFVIAATASGELDANRALFTAIAASIRFTTLPTPTVLPTDTDTPEPTNTLTATATLTPTITSTRTATLTLTNTLTATATATTLSANESPTLIDTPTSVPSETPGVTGTP